MIHTPRPPRICLYTTPGDPEEITRLKGYAVSRRVQGKRKYFTTDIYARRKELQRFSAEGLIFNTPSNRNAPPPPFRLRENVARVYTCYLAVAWFAEVAGTFQNMEAQEYSETARELYYNVLARDDEKAMGLPDTSTYIDFINKTRLMWKPEEIKRSLSELSTITHKAI